MRLKDVLHLPGLESQIPDLMEGGLTHVTRRAHHPEKQTHGTGRGGVITDAKARIHQEGALVRFHEEAGHAIFHGWEIRSHRAAVEKMYSHKVSSGKNAAQILPSREVG